CRARLSTGMQTEPTPETVALASRMRAVAPPRRKEAPTPALALSPATFLEGPLLGRTRELSTLIKVYHTAHRGQTQVVLLEGEMGIGKTRLATEFLAWAEVEGADVLQGQAFETGGQLPYRPVIEALRPRIERENAPDDLLSDLWLAELARLLPELCDRYPDLPAPTGDKSVARNRLFEAVARLGQALAARVPLVLFIDDVQWADAASLDVVHYLARRFAESQTPALLLLTLRMGASAMRCALAEGRSGIDRARPLTMRWWSEASPRPVCAKSSAPGSIGFRPTPLRCWWQEPSSARESPLSTCVRWPISQNMTDSLPWTRCCIATCCTSRSARAG